MTKAELVKASVPKIVTWSVVIVAGSCAYLLYSRWTADPWTRDGQVRADIAKLAPQVDGAIVHVAVGDNQFVSQGDLLFEVDPSSYQLAVENAKIALDQAREDVASLEASVKVSEAKALEASVNVTSAERNIDAAEASVRSAEAAVEAARAGVTSAEQLIKQQQAELTNAKSEASRAQRLVDKKAGSIEDAESTAATALAKEAQLSSAKAGLTQAHASLDQAKAGLSEANVNLLLAKDSFTEAQAAATSARAAVEQAKATLGTPGDENVRVKTAKVNLSQAELDMSRTKIRAPCNGYISNLSVDEGTYAAVGQPLVVVVDSDSFRVHAYFQETKLQHIQPGDAAIVTLMSHPGQEVAGVVESIGNAVNPPNIAATEGEAGEVPQIQPTFDWVRLPQRVPVRIRLNSIPDGVQLISGSTASIAVRPPAGK